MRQLPLVFILLLLSSYALFAQPAPQKATTADVPMLLRGTTPAVEVIINGQGPFLFAIDTGGQGQARVDSSLVEKLKLQTVGQVQGSDGSGRNARAMDVVRLDSVSFGGVEFRNVEAASRNYNTNPNMPKIDGILGFNLFADYLLTLDYPAKRVRLTRGELPQADGAQVLNFESFRGVPIVQLNVGAEKINAHIDSGNSIGGFVLPTALAEKLTFAAPPQVVGRAGTVTSVVEIKQARIKETIKLGRFEFKEPEIIFPAVSEDANIGGKVLREFALTFDQKNKRLRLERSEAAKNETSRQTTALDLSMLKDYAGSYGERSISIEDGALFLQRQGGPKLKMVAAGRDEFMLERVPEARIKFVRDADGAVVEIQVLNRVGEWEKSKKDQR